MIKKINFLLLSSSALLSTMVLVSCFNMPEEVVTPSWKVTLSLPLASDTVFMHEILDTNENLIIVDSPSVGDSIYLIVVEDLETSTKLQDKLEIPVPLLPSYLQFSGQAGVNGLTTATVYNPDPEYHIDTAEFKTGELILHMANDNFSDVYFQIILPGFKNKVTHQVVSVADTIPSFTDKTFSIPLADVNYSELPVTGVNNTQNYSSQATPGFLIIGKVFSSSTVNVNMVSSIINSDIRLSRFVGDLKQIELGYYEETIQTDFGANLEDFKNKISFNDIKLNVSAEMFGQIKNVKVFIDSFSVTGRNHANNTISQMRFNGNTFYKDSLVAGQSFSRVFNKTNTNLNEFLNNLPDEITIRNKFYVRKNNNLPGESQVISNSDSLKILASLSAPLNLSLVEVNYTDTLDVDLSDDDRDKIDNAEGGIITVAVDNLIALGGSATVKFLDYDYNELFTLKSDDNSTSFMILPASVNQNGVPSVASQNELTTQLSAEEINYIVNSKYILLNVAVNTTGSTATQFGPNVRIRAKDFFKFRIYGTVDYRVDTESSN